MRNPSKMPVRGGSRSRYSIVNPCFTTPDEIAAQSRIKSWVGMWPTRVPATSCPGSDFTANQLILSRMRILVCLAGLLMPAAALAQDVHPGRRTFEATCGRCHGGDGTGAEMGPSIVTACARGTTDSSPR